MKKLVVFFLLNFIFINKLNAETIEVKYSDCVDGDTIKVLINGEKTTVRLLAVDTPETVHPTKEEEPFGKEASNYTCKAIQNANKIELEYDPKSTKADKYGRHLAWVYVDDKMIQKGLIEKGYAKIDYLYGDYKYVSELEEIQNTAKNNKVGIWSNEQNIIEDNENKKTTAEEKGIVDKILDYIEENIIQAINDIIKEIENGIKSIFN